MAVLENPNLVRRAREDRGLTRFQLAAQVGISISTIDRLENEGKLPNAQTLFRIADALGVTVDSLRALVEGSPTPAPGPPTEGGGFPSSPDVT
jgi:transcriptional regulator with XRE-family HTH domain